jgi:hypothetical protein
MNKIYRVIWSKTHNTWIAVSELAKSTAGRSTTVKQNSPSETGHYNDLSKNLVFGPASFVFKNLCLSIALISGAMLSGTAWAANYSATPTIDNAIGNGFGSYTNTENNGSQLTKVAGIAVKATGLSIDSITSYTIDGIETTDTNSVTAFKNALKTGGNITLGQVSNAIGQKNLTLGQLTNAIGQQNIASGQASSAIGYNNTASGDYSSVFGMNSKATHTGATAIGLGSETDRDYSISVGKAGAPKQITNVAAGTAATDAVNLGQVQGLLNAGNNTVSGNYSSAVGSLNKASNDYSSAIGTNNISSGGSSAALGFNNKAESPYSSAMGTNNTASGNLSTAQGFNNKAEGLNSGAIGVNNQAIGANAFAIGANNQIDEGGDGIWLF